MPYAPNKNIDRREPQGLGRSLVTGRSNYNRDTYRLQPYKIIRPKPMIEVIGEGVNSLFIDEEKGV